MNVARALVAAMVVALAVGVAPARAVPLDNGGDLGAVPGITLPGADSTSGQCNAAFHGLDGGGDWWLEQHCQVALPADQFISGVAALRYPRVGGSTSVLGYKFMGTRGGSSGCGADCDPTDDVQITLPVAPVYGAPFTFDGREYRSAQFRVIVKVWGSNSPSTDDSLSVDQQSPGPFNCDHVGYCEPWTVICARATPTDTGLGDGRSCESGYSIGLGGARVLDLAAGDFTSPRVPGTWFTGGTDATLTPCGLVSAVGSPGPYIEDHAERFTLQFRGLVDYVTGRMVDPATGALQADEVDVTAPFGATSLVLDLVPGSSGDWHVTFTCHFAGDPYNWGTPVAAPSYACPPEDKLFAELSSATHGKVVYYDEDGDKVKNFQRRVTVKLLTAAKFSVLERSDVTVSLVEAGYVSSDGTAVVIERYPGPVLKQRAPAGTTIQSVYVCGYILRTTGEVPG